MLFKRWMAKVAAQSKHPVSRHICSEGGSKFILPINLQRRWQYVRLLRGSLRIARKVKLKSPFYGQPRANFSKMRLLPNEKWWMGGGESNPHQVISITLIWVHNSPLLKMLVHDLRKCKFSSTRIKMNNKLFEFVRVPAPQTRGMLKISPRPIYTGFGFRLSRAVELPHQKHECDCC